MQHCRVIIFFTRPNSNVAIAVPPRDALIASLAVGLSKCLELIPKDTNITINI